MRRERERERASGVVHGNNEYWMDGGKWVEGAEY